MNNNTWNALTPVYLLLVGTFTLGIFLVNKLQTIKPEVNINVDIPENIKLDLSSIAKNNSINNTLGEIVGKIF